MARRSKKRGTKKRTIRRTKSKSFGNVDFTAIMWSGVGGLGARLIDKVLPATLDARLVAGGKMAVGIAMPMLAKDPKTKKMLSEIGAGMVAVSLLDLVQSFGFMAGIGYARPSPVQDLALVLDRSDRLQGTTSVMGEYTEVMGDSDINVMNGSDDINVMNGYAEESFEDMEELM